MNNFFIASDNKNKKIAKKLSIFLKQKTNYSVDFFSYKTIEETCDKILQLKKDNLSFKVVIISDDGIYPFMFLSKSKGFVVAEISDEYSAMLTAEHNNPNVLSFASILSTQIMMEKMVMAFFSKEFSGQRHKARIDMLDKMLEKEDK